ncbi:MAG: nucleotidyl transferase AbiEii/AbiGii toxin family protein [Flavisolibacter sp.]
MKIRVSCYIKEMMEATGQQALIEKYALQTFEVKVLSKERTFCEKIMSLVRFSNTENPYDDLSKKIRHVYDLHMMLKNGEISEYFKSTAFDDMLNIVGNDDVQSFKNNNQWLSQHPAEALIFQMPGDTWQKIRGTYQISFKDMVTGILPTEHDLNATLTIIAERLKNVTWSVKPSPPKF